MRSFTFDELDHLFLESGYLDELDVWLAYQVLCDLRFLLNNPKLLDYFMKQPSLRDTYERILGSLSYSKTDSFKVEDSIFAETYSKLV